MPMEKMKLTFVNVGYGEAILLECPDPGFEAGQFVMLIDGGSAEDSEFTDRSSGRIPLVEYLAERGLSHIDLMVSTHIHEDHICGMVPVAKMLPPAALWQTLSPELAGHMHPLDTDLAATTSQNKFIRALNDYRRLCKTPPKALRAGDSGTLCQGLTYRVLAPAAEAAEELERHILELMAEPDREKQRQLLAELDVRMNNYSLMMLLDYRGTRILLPGDTNCLGYGGIDPAELFAHLFKVGHHGQQDGASPELLEKIRPRMVTCCASSDRRYNSAHPNMLRMLREQGAELYFSDCPEVEGAVLPPHQALTFTVGADGDMTAQYL